MPSDKKKDKRTFILYYLLIAVITFIAYYPSLFHMPRSDHFIYLANTAGQHDFFSLVFKNYSFNRMDLSYGITDGRLFRPLLYVFLGLERWLFGLNFTCWQTTGIFLHLTVLWFLLKHLYETYKSFWAFLLTLYFAVLFAGTEMVLWSHINGYMIFIIFILIVLNKVQRIGINGQISRTELLSIVAALTLAVFTYELGVIFCVLFPIYFAISFSPERNGGQPENLIKEKNKNCVLADKKTALISFCLPVLFYFLFNSLDFHYRNLTLSDRQSPVLSAQYILTLTGNTVPILFWWFHSGLFPSRIFTEIGQRTFMYPLYIDFSDKPALSVLTIVQTLTSIGLIAAFLIVIKTHINKTFLKQRWKFLSLLFCLFCSYAFAVSLGRVSVQGLERILVENPYYHYFFWVFFLPFVYGLIPFDQLQKSSHSTSQRIFTALLIILIVFNYRFTSTLTSKRAHKDKPQWALNQHIQALARQPTGQDRFSFHIDPSVNTNAYYLNWAKRAGDPNDKTYNYFNLLYPEYYREDGAKYIFTFDGNNNWK